MNRIFTLAVASIMAATIVSTAESASKEKKHLLVVTHTTGFRHSSIPTAEKVLGEMAAKTGAFDVDYCRNDVDVRNMMTTEVLKKYDGVIFANTTGNLGIPDLRAFLDWLKAGKGFIGMHSATDTYHPDSVGGDRGYVEMIGAEFKTHDKQCEIEARNNDLKNPATKHLGASWKILDEIYLFKENTRPTTHVLLSTSSAPCVDNPQSGDYMVAWCHDYGKGRVFYTSLGHREDVWENPVYQEHILGGIKWVLRLTKGNAKPNNPIPGSASK